MWWRCWDQNAGSVEVNLYSSYAGTKDQWCKGQGYTVYERKTLRLASQLVEPPTADPHGGWCGGWRLETSGYPIERHRAKQQCRQDLLHSWRRTCIAKSVGLCFAKRSINQLRIDSKADPVLEANVFDIAR